MTGTAGASANAGGPSAAGGRGAAGGGSSAAGSTDVAGSSASGGNSNSGGATGAAGAQSGGSANGGAGAGNGGAVSGGAGNNGGNANGGSNNAGSAGASTAGSNNGGASGTVGAGGAAGNPTCQDLIATAAQQLDAARVCTNSGNAPQCTGSVSATCGCEVPVESDDSPETKAYLATLAMIQEKHCIQACPAIACVLGHAECKSQGGSSSACVAAPLTPVN